MSHSLPNTVSQSHRLPILMRLEEKLDVHLENIKNRNKRSGDKESFWAWALGFHMSKQHSSYKRELIEQLIDNGNTQISTEDEKGAKEDEKGENLQQIEPLSKVLDHIQTPSQQRATFYHRLYTAMAANEAYSIKHGIRSGQTATVLSECMRLVNEADDAAYELLDKQNDTNSHQQDTVVPTQPSEHASKPYHTFHDSYLAKGLKHWRQAPVVTTIGVVLSVLWILFCFYPNVLLWSAQSQMLFAIQTTIHCIKRSAQLLACALGILAIWGVLGYVALKQSTTPDSQTTQPVQAKNLETNTWANNPIARIFSGMRCLFKTMYDYGRANPIAMAVFGFAYWVPATMILGHDYGGWQFSGVFAGFYTYIVLPISHGLLSAHAAPWITALCVGFLCGQIWLIAHDVITRRAQSLTLQSIYDAIIKIFDTVLMLAVLFSLAWFMAGFPFLFHGSGTWYLLNFMTLSIKPALLLYDIISDPKRSIIGSTIHTIVGVPYWIVMGKGWYASTPMPKYDAKYDALLGTWLQRLQRAGHDLWHLLKIGLYEISVGFFLRDFFFSIAHVYVMAVVKIIAMTLCLCRCPNASGRLLTHAYALNREMAIFSDTFDGWIRLGLQRFEFKDLLLGLILFALAPPVLTWLYGGAALVKITYPWFYPFIGWFGHSMIGATCAWSMAWLALITLTALCLKRLAFACLPNDIDHAQYQSFLTILILQLICITCMLPGILTLCHVQLQANTVLILTGITLLLPLMGVVLLSHLYPAEPVAKETITKINKKLTPHASNLAICSAYFYNKLGFYPTLQQLNDTVDSAIGKDTRPVTRTKMHRACLDAYLSNTANS